MYASALGARGCLAPILRINAISDMASTRLNNAFELSSTLNANNLMYLRLNSGQCLWC